MTYRTCPTPGCPELTTGGPCPTHRAERDARRPRRPTARKRGYDAKWERTRARHLRLHPACTKCGVVRTDNHVDHVDGQGPTGPRGHDSSNLMTLCPTHHAAKTYRQDGGLGQPRRGEG